MYKALLYTLLIIQCTYSIAQATFQTVVFKNPSASYMTAGSIAESSTGDIYVTGTTDPGGWYVKIRLVKLSSKGDLIWDTTYAHTPLHEYFPEMMPTADGGVILACDSYSYPLNDEDTLLDILVWKINKDGAIEWQKILSARNFYDMTPSKDGGYLLTAAVHEDYYYQGGDIIVYKIDANGNELWSKRLGQQTGFFPYEREYPTSIKQIDDQIYVCGFHNHDGWLELDGIMYVLDESGNLKWDIFLFNTPENDKIRINSVFKFDDHYYFKATTGLFEFDPNSGNYFTVPDSVIFVFTSSGKGYNYNIECGVKKASAIVPNAGIYSLWLYDDLVAPYYQNIIPEISGTFAEMIVADDGGILVLTNSGQNMQITKTDCIGNVSFWSDECNSKISTEADLIIYPNPSQDEILIEADFDFDEVVIYSVKGQMIEYINSCACPRMTLNISGFAAGVYVIRIAGANQNAISRFIKI